MRMYDGAELHFQQLHVPKCFIPRIPPQFATDCIILLIKELNIVFFIRLQLPVKLSHHNLPQNKLSFTLSYL